MSDIHKVYLGMGTNLGDRAANLQSAATALTEHVNLVQTSQVYETPPWGFVEQPPFLNQVVEIETRLLPPDLLRVIKQIEFQLGRVPNFRYGPRLIDIDILLFDQLILDLPGLSIPHPRLEERAFMLVPLAEIAPQAIHPIHGLMVQELLARIDPSGVEVYHAKN